MHSLEAQHWTLLVLNRAGASEESKPEPFQTQYYDSLLKPSQTALDEAAGYLNLLQHLLQPAEVQWAKPAESRQMAGAVASGCSCGASSSTDCSEEKEPDF